VALVSRAHPFPIRGAVLKKKKKKKKKKKIIAT